MSNAWSWMDMDDMLPIVAMLMVTCLDIAVLTIVKAAMNDGMSSIVYVIYHNALGTLILLPFFIFHILRICLFQVLWYLGVYYSSPTMASAILNLFPGITFLIALLFRMEKIDIRSSSSVAKLLGTMMAISGTMVFTFYQGPKIFHTILSSISSNQMFLSQSSKWIFGSLIILISGTFGCIWIVLQTATARYPDQQTIVFFYCLFGTIQCVALSPFLESNRSAWVLRPGIELNAVVLGGVYSTVARNSVLTWCMQKKGPVFVSMFSPLSIVVAVIMGVTYLGDSLHLGSAIGATMVSAGFYTVIWGQAKEKNKIMVVMGDNVDVSDEPGSSDQITPLLSPRMNQNV